MKQVSTVGTEGRTAARKMPARKTSEKLTIGIDVGDRSSHYCVLKEEGAVVASGVMGTTKKALAQAFGALPESRIALEVGAQSAWISRLLRAWGHEVIVANARQVKLISQSSRKDDRVDAETLARLARADPELLRPVRHRGEQAQLDLARVRVRANLVEARTALVNAARGLVKPFGERLASCDAGAVGVATLAGLPAELAAVVQPLVEQVAALTVRIRKLDVELEQIAREQYPETRLLKQISGVGSLIALTFVLTIDDATRFAKSREVGCYVGLRPRRSQSGASEPELPISKEGDRYLRALLVQAAHYILGWRGPDTDLRRWGLRLASRGGKNAKKRAVVAVARKLAVLLHHLWVSGEVYEPLRQARAAAAA